jgi:hypothetical protein
LVATGYDLGNIVVVDMNSSPNPYDQVLSYQFPTAFASAIATAGLPALPTVQDGDWHGEGVFVQSVITGGILTNVYVYVLFNFNPGGGYQTYLDSVVAKFELTLDPLSGDPTLTFNYYVRTGQASSSFLPYGDKLYVCAIGGMQQPDKSNPNTALWCVDISNPTSSNPTAIQLQPNLANSSVPGDYYDITIANDGAVFVLLGHFVSNYGAFVGNVLRTTVSNLLNTTNPIPYIQVETIANRTGNLWAIHAEPIGTDGRFWFVYGNELRVYQTLPTATSTPYIPYSTATLGGGPQYTQFNSFTFLPPDGPAPQAEDRGLPYKPTNSHNRLAREVREAKVKLEEGKEEK